MSYNIYCAPHELTSPKIALAMHEAMGFPIVSDQLNRDAPWAGFGSPWHYHTLEHAINGGFDYVYADHGYFARHVYYRLTKNGKFHTGEGYSNCARVKRFVNRPKRWAKGKNIIIAPQSKAFFKRNGIDPEMWMTKMFYKIRKRTDRPIIVHHKTDPKPLHTMFSDAWLLVTHSSNSALEALIHGVPVICTAPCHASIMSTDFDNLEKPFYPENRLEWAGVLADNQWTLDEIRRGQANDLFR